MMKVFDNAGRNRYYGKRIGDTVKLSFYPIDNTIAEVIEYGAMDNNRIYVKLENGETIKWIAEHCTIIKKVEDDSKGSI